jgi:hypothetical protein
MGIAPIRGLWDAAKDSRRLESARAGDLSRASGRMAPRRNTANVELIMTDFAERTGILNDAMTPVRYLWTDAFPVGNFLSLSDATGST